MMSDQSPTDKAADAWDNPGWKEAAVEYSSQRPDQGYRTDEQCIAILAGMSKFDYDRQRKSAAEQLGIKVATLDKAVRDHRAQSEEDSEALPHWKVEPWPDPVDGAALLDDIKKVLCRYIVLPKGAPEALALWTLHAWTMDAGDISPFLVLVSPTKRCGKTSALILLYFLTPRSELASNITGSALFRYIEEVRPTLLIDEADSFVKDNEELRGILNSGHTKAAAYVIRNVEVNGEHKPRRFSTWAPKAIATIRGLADTLEDRAIMVRLQRKLPTATVARLRRRDSNEFAALRSKAARWAADNCNRLEDPDPKIPDSLNDRAADNWRPLLAIADLAGGFWPERAREAACLLSGEGQDGAINVTLLAHIKMAFGDADVIRSADLIAKLIADPEQPWAEWKHGRPLTRKQLAGLLAPFHIISVNVNPLGQPQGKGYRRADFEGVWEAYCSGQNSLACPSGASEASIRPCADETGTTRDFQSVHDDRADGSKTANLFNNHAGLDGWTDRKAENGAKGRFDHDRDSASDPGDIPECLRRHRCNYCGGQIRDHESLSLAWLPGRHLAASALRGAVAR
jgi:putative DNA primase/helicase